LIDGLENNCAAMVLKFHHALTGGVGGVQIGTILFDLSEGFEPQGPMAALPEAPRRRWLSDYRDAARYNAGLVCSALSSAIKIVPKLVSNGILRPIDTVSSAAGLAASVYRTVRPVNRTVSTLIGKRSLIRRLGVLEVLFAQLRAAGHRGDGALNDAFVAGVAGGLR
jgi:diacylglycerol O-acyltransferase / wax synthase